MSSGTEVLIIPAIALGGVFVVGAAAVGTAGYIAYGTGKAAYAAARHLEDEYSRALDAFNVRAGAERADNLASSQAHSVAMSSAASLAARTRVNAAENANAAFLKTGVERLLKRIGGLPEAGPELPAQCAQLRQALLTGATPEHFSTYERLCEAVGALAAKRRAVRAGTVDVADLQAEIALLEGDLASPILSSPGCAALHAELKKQMANVRHLLLHDAKHAEQGLKLLRRQTHRQLAEQATKQDARRKVQEKQAVLIRELAGNAAARLQAVVAQDVLPEMRVQAEEALRRLSRLLAGDLPDNLAPLQRASAEADELFNNTQHALDEVALAAYLESQVRDVLSEMGYNVTGVAPESQVTADGNHSVIAVLDAGVGVQLQMDGHGNLVSEMVAFSESAAEVDRAAQERVCSLMDEVFEGLRGRQCAVREKKRRNHKPGQHRLRVVKRQKQVEAGATRQAAPLSRKAGE
jgi:hypothetical protein